MRAWAVVLVWSLACTRAERSSPDCDLVRRDPGNAAAKLTLQYPGAPVKVAEIIERCVAPAGSPCERLTKVIAALPNLMPAGSPAVTAPGGVAELCAGMPPEMQRCMMPSYALAHADECAKVRAQIAAGVGGPTEGEAGADAAPAAAPCGELRIDVARDRLTVRRDEEKTFPRPGSKADADALRALLEELAARCTGAAKLTSADDVPYQDVIAVMDAAVAVGFSAIGFDVPDAPAAPGDPSRPATTPDDLPRAPSIAVTTKAVSISGKEVARLPADVTEPVAAALAKLRAADAALPSLAVLQADAATPMRTVKQIIRGGRRAGFDDVAFAVKRK